LFRRGELVIAVLSSQCCCTLQVRVGELGSKPVPFEKPTKPAKQKNKKRVKGNRAMARPALGYLPQQNPCAQCGRPIAAPDWVESSGDHTCYLWCCRACGYRFEAVAYFAEAQSEREAIAA
jgi:hypothetical protein